MYQPIEGLSRLGARLGMEALQSDFIRFITECMSSRIHHPFRNSLYHRLSSIRLAFMVLSTGSEVAFLFDAVLLAMPTYRRGMQSAKTSSFFVALLMFFLISRSFSALARTGSDPARNISKAVCPISVIASGSFSGSETLYGAVIGYYCVEL